MGSIGQRFYLSFLACCGLYAVLFLASRLLGLIPNVFEPLSLALIPASAAVFSLMFHRRPTPVEAARKIDRHYGTKDLFLTTILLKKSVGEYKPLVVRDAEQAAASIKPVEVVTFHWRRRLGGVAIALLVLWGGLFFKQFDPFGRLEAAEQVVQRKKVLAEGRKATQMRVTDLKSAGDEGPESKDVRKALDNLKSSFRRMQPLEKTGNFKLLAANQKILAGKWRNLREHQLKKLLSQSATFQKFGGVDQDKLQKWTRELQEGSTESLRQELSELQEELKRLMKATDPAKKAEIAQKLKKRLKDLEEFASKKVNSKQLVAALKRAMKQLESSRFEGMSFEALEALSQSLNLTKFELEEIAQSVKDLKALEEGLKVLQMGKNLNGQEKLDGEACAACTSMSDYEELFAQMMAQLGGEVGDKEGSGMGGEGIGRGGKAPEDDSLNTGFKTELSKSTVTAGKVLLSLKTKGLSDRGDAKQDYRKLIRTIKQGISEAIEQEQIPPGYHDGIKSYFDNIEESRPESDDAK
jgi:hypothetical protein